MKKNRLYLILLIACFTGYAYLGISLFHSSNSNSTSETVCLIKNISGIPCPSCGTTRSVLSIIHGDPINALFINPLGYIIFAILILVPLWILFDFLSRKKTLKRSYTLMEKFLVKRYVALPLISLILLNWIWNIHKGI